MSDTTAPTPIEARAMLDDADRIGRSAHEATRWPYVAFLLALGATTAGGTFAMALADGGAYFAVLVGLLVVVATLIGFFMWSIREHAGFARSRRWSTYIAIWLVPYAVSIVAVTTFHGQLVVNAITSAVLFLAVTACAVHEARR